MVDEYLFTNGRKGEFDTSDDLQKNCLWFCFNKLVQQGLDQVRASWDTHYIRRSRYNTQAGDVGARNCKIPTVNEDIIPPCKHTFTTNHKTTMI